MNRVAVVTPLYRPHVDWLRKCLLSVAEQTYPCDHFLVNDGDDSFDPSALAVASYSRIPGPHEDYGNAARAVGSVLAIAGGFDAIAFLDADNWYEPTHIQSLLALQQETGAGICTAGRNLVGMDGELLGRCPECDGERFVDTSSLIIFRDAFEVIPIWYRMPVAVSAIGDKVFWREVLKRNLSRAHSPSPSVNYRTNYRAHYFHFGRFPPPGAKHVFMNVSPSGEYISAITQTYPNPAPGTIDAQTAPRPPQRAKRVSLCMIVRNEADNLGRCLESVRGVFDEMVVVDTGSNDTTAQIARDHGAQVFPFDWVDDFSAARNESMRHASGDWLLWLDADEFFDEANLRLLRDLLDRLGDEDRCYLMRQRSLPDQITGSTLVVDQIRLFRRLPGMRWMSRIHEQISFEPPRQPVVAKTEIQILHRGYLTQELRLRKRQRNLQLLQLQLKEYPDDSFALYCLANTQFEGGDLPSAIRYLRRCLQLAPPAATFRAKAVHLLAETFHRTGQISQALEVCREGRKEFATAPEFWFLEGMLRFEQGDLSGARQCFETYLEAPEGDSFYGRELELREFRARDYLAHVYLRSGQEKDAEAQWRLCVERAPHCEKGWLALVEVLLGQQRHLDIEALLRRASQDARQDVLLPIMQARIEISRGQVANARGLLEQVVRSNPTLLFPRVFLCDILLRLTSDAPAAEEQLRAILALVPNEPQTLSKLAALTGAKRTLEDQKAIK